MHMSLFIHTSSNFIGNKSPLHFEQRFYISNGKIKIKEAICIIFANICVEQHFRGLYNFLFLCYQKKVFVFLFITFLSIHCHPFTQSYHVTFSTFLLVFSALSTPSLYCVFHHNMTKKFQLTLILCRNLLLYCIFYLPMDSVQCVFRIGLY